MIITVYLFNNMKHYHNDSVIPAKADPLKAGQKNTGFPLSSTGLATSNPE